MPLQRPPAFAAAEKNIENDAGVYVRLATVLLSEAEENERAVAYRDPPGIKKD
jgi:hypothetical protein